MSVLFRGNSQNSIPWWADPGREVFEDPTPAAWSPTDGAVVFDFELEEDLTVFGGAGNDEILARLTLLEVTEVGAEYADADVLAVLLYGGAGDDRLTTGNELSTLFGGTGSDILHSDRGGATLYGGDGDDILTTDNWVNSRTPLFGGDGDDTLSVLNGPLHAFGGLGDDSFFGGDGADNIYGGEGALTASTANGDDIIFAGNGAVSVDGGAGIDRLVLSIAGGETILAPDGMVLGTGHHLDLTSVEVVVGSTEDDVLQFDGPVPGRQEGRGGNDVMVGDAAANSLIGGPGQDTMIGGAGDDFYGVNDLGDVIIERGTPGSGTDTVASSISLVIPKNVEVLRLSGSEAINATGADRADHLIGNDEGNRLDGGAGDDTLTGRGGADTLVGGLGSDTFVITSYVDSGAGAAKRDVIDDFDAMSLESHDSDLIDLRALDANTLTFGVKDAFTFIGETSFSGTPGELRTQNHGGTNAVLIEGDHNGDGVADLHILVYLTTFIQESDFIL